MDAFKSDRDLITEIAKQQKIDPEILLGPTPPVAEKLAAPKPVSPVYVMEAQAKTIETLLEKFRSAVEDIAELGKVLTTIKPLIVDVLTTLYADDVEALKIDRARMGIDTPVISLENMLKLAAARAEHLQKYGRGKRV
ncbi:MAG: hypothetical protein K9G27_05360 [Sphingomonadaceae bacterium]|jgi:hypothetical protein|nr:hypothetical protein [Sphingomonadaceae bacterium]